MSQAFTYDPLNRLLSATETVSGSQTWKQTNGFDQYGNRWIDQFNTTGNVMGPISSQTDISAANNRIQKAGYSYDSAGNMIAEPGKTYTFDAENKIATANVGGSVSTYVYDGDGHRVKKITPQGTSVFVYDAAGQMIAEYSDASPAGPGGTQYSTADHLGTPRVWTNSAGAVISRHDYLPFWEDLFAGLGLRSTALGYSPSTQADGQRNQFTQKERDVESGLDYFLARYYSSAEGRFTSTDPVIVTPERFRDPQQFNQYAYTRNNPLRFVDPTGKILTLSGDVDEAKRQLALILGTADADKRITYDAKTNTITVDLTGIDVSQNEGAVLLNDLVTSQNRFDLSIGSSVDTLGGPISLDPKDKSNRSSADMANLDRNPDNRFDYRKPPGKVDKEKPQKGIDDQVAFNLAGRSPRESLTSLKPAVIESIIFHELAEAYAKIEHNKQYAAAHREAIDREARLRDQRPYLKAYNPGSGPGDNTIIKK